MPVLKRNYGCTKNYDLFVTCHSHGWINLDPFRWEDRENRLTFAAVVGGQAVDISAEQYGRKVLATIISKEKLPAESLLVVDAVVHRALSLDQETAELMAIAGEVGEAYQNLVRKGAGRMLRGASLWEDAAKTLFTTNCSWALTQRMCQRACSGEFSMETTSGRFPFPSPSSIAERTPEELREKMPIGYRAEYLNRLAKAFSEDPGLSGLEKLKYSYEEAYKLTSKLKGFGPYARTHLLIMAGYYEKIPVDSEVAAYMRRNHKCRNAQKFAERRYRAWGRHKWWGLKFEKMLRRQNWLGD